MYKTIRHGENSLQYTILPQNDDFRLEGKNKSAGSSKKPKNKKPKRRSFFAYVGLLFVCTVIVGAVLVPFLVSNRIPTEWFLRTKAALTTENKETGPTTHTGNALANAMLNKGNLLALNRANVGKNVKIISKDGVEKIILKVNKTSSPTDANGGKNSNPFAAENDGMHLDNSPTNTGGAVNNAETELEGKITIHDLNDFKNIVTTIPPQDPNKENETTPKSLPVTTLPETLAPPTTTATLVPTLLNRSLSSASLPNVPRASLQSSLNQNTNNSSSTQPTITTRIMQVPLLKSTAKKPAIPPVLVKNLSPIQPTPDNSNLNDIIPIPSKTYTAGGGGGGKEVNNKEATNSDWIHTHWPYIDPSTYFQWNGYKTEDSVLLPALLGFALIGVILIITVCLVARNKRTIVTSVRKRNRNDIEETGAEDNTTLLTNTNLSDED